MTQEIKKHKPFPTTIIEDFFEDPYKVIELANSLEYYDSEEDNYAWPGKRSNPLYVLDYNLFNNTVLKVLSAYFPFAKFTYNDARLHFQKISPVYESGWVHRDDNTFTFIVYLNNTKTIDGGTSICIPKNKDKDKEIILHSDKKQESYRNPNKLKEYESYRLENNNQFEETIRVDNVFNRCVMFDAHSYHKANGFNTIDNSEDRLTLIGFIQDFTLEY